MATDFCALNHHTALFQIHTRNVPPVYVLKLTSLPRICSSVSCTSIRGLTVVNSFHHGQPLTPRFFFMFFWMQRIARSWICHTNTTTLRKRPQSWTMILTDTKWRITGKVLCGETLRFLLDCTKKRFEDLKLQSLKDISYQ